MSRVQFTGTLPYIGAKDTQCSLITGTSVHVPPKDQQHVDRLGLLYFSRFVVLVHSRHGICTERVSRMPDRTTKSSCLLSNSHLFYSGKAPRMNLRRVAIPLLPWRVCDFYIRNNLAYHLALFFFMLWLSCRVDIRKAEMAAHEECRSRRPTTCDGPDSSWVERETVYVKEASGFYLLEDEICVTRMSTGLESSIQLSVCSANMNWLLLWSYGLTLTYKSTLDA